MELVHSIGGYKGLKGGRERRGSGKLGVARWEERQAEGRKVGGGGDVKRAGGTSGWVGQGVWRVGERRNLFGDVHVGAGVTGCTGESGWGGQGSAEGLGMS